MGLPEIGIEVLKVMLPPKAGDDKAQQRWRWMMFLTVMSLLVNAILSYGVVPGLFPGFALAANQAQVEKRVDILTTLGLEHEIKDKQMHWCVATDKALRQELRDDIERLENEYESVNRRRYSIPKCEDL